ncbi:MAG: type II secretion system minor pseudopilin GspJ [Pseudomonadota bacterium]
MSRSRGGVRRPAVAGFTLLELLIAIAIFALLGLGTYRMLDSVMRTDEATRNQEQVLRELARAIWTLERDVLQAVARPIRDGYGDPRPAFIGESQAADGSAAFELTRSGWRNPTGQARSQLQRVRWRLDGERLERLYWVVLDRAVDSEPRVQKVLNGVTSLQLRYLDEEGAWLDDWPPQQNSDPGEGEAQLLMPQALELTLEHARYGSITRLLRLPEGPGEPAPRRPDEGGLEEGGGQQEPVPEQPPEAPPRESSS